MTVLVAGHRPVQPGGHQPAARGLAAPGQGGGQALDRVAVRQRVAGHAAGHPDGAGRGQDAPHPLRLPPAEVGGEHREVVLAARRDHPARSERGDHRVMDAQVAAGPLQGLPEAFLASGRVPADPGGEVHGSGPGPLDHPSHLMGRLAPADDQPAAPLPEPGVQVRQAVREERQSVGRVEPGTVDGVVPDEQRDDLVRVPQGGTQHRMVVQTQIGGEQHHRDTHGTPASSCCTGSSGRTTEGRSAAGGQAAGNSISATGAEVGPAEPRRVRP